jgi:hypothetical protein
VKSDNYFPALPAALAVPIGYFGESTRAATGQVP